MERTIAHYAEETRRNVVAAVRSGLSQKSVSRRLGIPASTISQWLRDPKYSGIVAASREVLEALPEDPSRSSSALPRKLVQIKGPQRTTETGPGPRCAGMRICLGRLSFESDSFSSEDIAMIIRALGEADVL